MVAYTAQRLQTNAAWSARFRFTSSALTGWTLAGRAVSTKNTAKTVTLTAGTHLVINPDGDDAHELEVSLSVADAAALGEGTILFEIMRTLPAPKRPVLRFTIKNHAGVAA